MKKFLRAVARSLYYIPSNIYNKFIFILTGVKSGVGFESRGRIFVSNKGIIEIAENVRINSSSTANPIGIGDRMYFQVLKGAKVFIDSGTGISNTAITCAQDIRIGKSVRIGSGCKIYDTDFHSLNPYMRTSRPENRTCIKHKPIVIDDYAFIGAGSYILKGTKIGFASVIGAGSVVTGEIPPFTIWAGNPAKLVRELSAEEREIQVNDNPRREGM